MQNLECQQDLPTNVFEIERQKNIEKWMNANYLIAAKQEVDSLWYIAKHQDVLSKTINIDFRYIVELHRNTFYINAADVIDKLILASKLKKRDVCNQNANIERLYYYRDQHAAHKDRRFCDNEWQSLMEIKEECKRILDEVCIVCKSVLPNNITLDYVCYDAFLFRVIYGINQCIENTILNAKHPFKNTQFQPIVTGKLINLFNNVEDKWKIENPNNYGVIFENGLIFEEGIQKRQTSCIRWNVLQGDNSWCTPSIKECREVFMAIKLGYMDVFNVPYNLSKPEREYVKDFQIIEDAGKILVYDVSISDNIIKKSIQRYL